MSYLVRCTFTLDDGRLLHDETIVSGDDTLQSVANGITLPGIGHGVLRVEFDPPLVAEVAPVREDAA